MESSNSEIASGSSQRTTAVVHIAPVSASRLARLVAPVLNADSAAGPGVRTLVLVDDEDAASDVAHHLAAEGEQRLIALTNANRAKRVVARGVPAAIVAPHGVAAALIRASALPLAGLRNLYLVAPRAASAASTESIAAVMAELPKGAVRTLIAPVATPEVEALIERHFFKARRLRESAWEVTGFSGSVQVLASTHATRWSSLRRLIDQIDPASAVIIPTDETSAAEAKREIALFGYTDPAVVRISEGDVEFGTSMVVFTGVPEGAQFQQAVNAGPAHLVVLADARSIGDVRALAGSIPVRAAVLDGPQARAAARQAAMRGRLREILASGEFARELDALIPLLDEFDGIEIAAAALAMVTENQRTPAPAPAREVPAERPQWERPDRPERSERPREDTGRAPRDDRGRPPREDRGRPPRDKFERGDRSGPPRGKFERGSERSGPPRGKFERSSERGGKFSRGPDERRGPPRGDSRDGPRGRSGGPPRSGPRRGQ